MTGAVNTSSICRRFLETTPQSKNLSISSFFASSCTSTNHSLSSLNSLRAVELVVGDAVVAEAAVVVAAKGDPLKVVEGPVEGDPLAVVDGVVEGDPLAVVDGAAEGDGEGGVPHELKVEVQAVTVLATARWSLNTGGVKLAARLGPAGGSNSSRQFGNCSVGRLGLNRIATG